MNHRADIQGLRAIAVISVLLFHVGYTWMGGGYIGVDVFFVISGYLITKQILKVLHDGTFSLSGFYQKRARRLLPALFATIGLTFIGAFLLFSPELFQQFGKSALASIFSVSNILFWTEAGYFDTAGHLKPLLHTWSLSVEEQFYLLWPVSLLFLWKVRWPILWTIAVAGVISFATFVVFPFSQSDGFYLMPFRIFQFAIGAAVIWIERFKAPAWLMEIMLFAGLALILGSAINLSAKDVFPGFNALPSTAGAALVIYAGTAKWTGFLLRNPVSVWIGKISYSLYLVHWPLIVFYGYQLSSKTSDSEKLALLAASFIAGVILFHTVEQRFRTETRPLHLTRLAGVAISLALATTALSASEGWSWRLGNRGEADIYGGQKCAPPRCASGPTNKKTDLYVIGDSHARAYYAGFAENYPDNRIVFFEAAGCPFYSPEFTLLYEKNPQADQLCRITRKMAFDEIRARPAPVVIAQNWTPTNMVSEKTGKVLPAAPDTTLFVDFLARELRKLHDTVAPNLYIVGSVPTMGGVAPPADCLRRPFFPKAECDNTVPLSNVGVGFKKFFNNGLSPKIGSFAKFVDPFQSICDDEKCLAVLDQNALYSDDTHLSAKGSIAVVKGFKLGMVSALP